MNNLEVKLDNGSLKGFLLQPFSILDDKNSRIFLIVFCAAFSSLFIQYYNPLNIINWQYDTTIGKLLSIENAGLVGAALLGVTQFIIRSNAKLTTFNVGQFCLWLLFEFWFLSSILFLIFRDYNQPFWGDYFLAFQYTSAIAIIPYFLACLLIAVRKLAIKVNHNEKITKVILKQHIFKDENGKIMLAIDLENLLFLKSENNYTAIIYLKNGQTEKKLIRTNLKKLENELKLFTNLIRIHRSYMVNSQNINNIQRKKGGFQIYLKQLPEMPFKVSETYKKSFESYMDI